jgi:U3 small nucleolar ribonucleoprotein protein IMP4
LRKVAITTSKRPARRTRSLCRDLEHAFPDAVYVQRGTKNLRDTILEALAEDAEVLLYVTEWKGNPSEVSFVDITEVPPETVLKFRLGGVKLQREFIGDRTELKGELTVTTSKRPVSGHVKVAEALADVLGVPFEPRIGPLSDVPGDVLIVVEGHPRYLGTWVFHKGDEKVGPALFYREFSTERETMEV